jgi:WD40 repeat protein
VATSPDDILVLAGMDDGTICLWEASTGQLLGQLSTDQSVVHSVICTSDGHGFLSGSGDNTIQLWEIDLRAIREMTDEHRIPGATNEGKGCATCTRTLTVPTGSVFSLSISLGGQWITSASKNDIITLWDKNGTPRLMLKGHVSEGALLCYVCPLD